MASVNDLGVYETVKNPSPAMQEMSIVSDLESRRKKDWRAPITMTVSSLAGVILILAHHFMNSYLDKKQIVEVGISQSWVSRISTALAFLVKMCLVITTGVAFIQRQWLNIHRETLRVKEIDALTGVLGNVFNFFTSAVWFRSPLLFLIAIVSWTIPFAAVVTPGSISVQQALSLESKPIAIPQPNWNGSIYAVQGLDGEAGKLYAKPLVYRIAYTAALSAKPLSIPSTYVNESYHLNFQGPAVRCGPAPWNMSVTAYNLYRNGTGGGSMYTYLSWVTSSANPNGSVPNVNSDATGLSLTLDQTSLDGSHIFVMAGIGNYRNVTVTECILHNVTYAVDFNFQYPNQTLGISISQYLNPVSVHDLYSDLTVPYREILAYAGIMDTFGKLLVGQTYYNHYGTNTTTSSSYEFLSIDWTHGEQTARGLESLFQNITLSFLSESSLIKNSTQAALVPVNVMTWPVTYVYNVADLWIPYGLCCGFTLVCLLIGMHAFMRNEGSYQNIFSTFIRAMGQEDIQRSIHWKDDAADPVPKSLANVRIDLKQNHRSYAAVSDR